MGGQRLSYSVPGKPANQVEQALDLARTRGQELNAFITLTPDEATRPPVQGPLAGVPIALKDLVATRGVRTTAGSRILKDWVPRGDAAIVVALREAGAVSIGKTNTHEFAFGTTNDNPHYGATRNPWNRALTTGGSSGGSAAAVAAGIVPLAVGTDTAGSIRIPAALCGCVGFKPGWNRLSAAGVVPLAKSLDTVGFLADSVAMARRGWQAALGNRQPIRSRSLEGLIVGVDEHHAFAHTDKEIVASVQAALRLMEEGGATIKRLRVERFADVMDIGVPLVRTEALRFHRRWYPERAAEYGPDVARSLEAARGISATQYLAARTARRRLEREACAALETVDVIVGPTVPVLAFPNANAFVPGEPGGELPRFAVTRLTYPWSLSRLPAISIPCGLSASRLPIGLQLATAAGEEAFLLDVAEAVESLLPAFPKPGA